jgi:arylsulfatase A-like enzyme
MTVGFVRPHSPWIVPEEYFELFPLDQIELPPYLEDDLADIPKVFLKTKYSVKDGQGDKLQRLQDAYGGEEGWKRWIQGYLASVAFVDDQFGHVLEALEESPHADNTIVVLTSDHGYHMGEKNWLFKLTTWEESTRVPLVIRGTGSGGGQPRTIDLPVSLIDLYPTLVQLCGLQGDPNREDNELPLDGHSLKPFLETPTSTGWGGPEVALSCIYGQFPVGRDEPGSVAEQHFTVRSRNWRYVLTNSGEEELYDHRSDPHEWHNLAQDETHLATKEKLKAQLQALLD